MLFVNNKKYVDVTNFSPVSDGPHRKFTIKKISAQRVLDTPRTSLRKQSKGFLPDDLRKLFGTFFDVIKREKNKVGGQRNIKEEKPDKVVPRTKIIKEERSDRRGLKVKSVKEELLGEVVHYFPKIKVCVIKLKKSISVGDRLRIKGRDLNFIQKVSSMQIDHDNVKQAFKGQEIGLQVSKEVCLGCQVYRTEK